MLLLCFSDAAFKCMRSMRQWLYHTFGSDRLIEFVAMATPEDLRVGAEYIKLADAYEEVPGGKNNRNYANVDVIVDVAKRHRCDAVWAGWGHASEYPSLPTALLAANIVFLGPGAKAMYDLGDKIASTVLAQSANVSCIPWSGDGVTVDYKSEGIPENKYLQCCVRSLEEAQAVVARIGLPVMIKASEGGGGKGIRKVETMDQLSASYSRVAAEVPGSPIFVMRMGSDCRHLEVQVLGDNFGNALALYGRDCSVQRRHQKIIEEGPIVVAPAELLREMERAAVRLAQLVGYSGAGTIEYLYTGGKYYFLELNPRLQVEHPVTELISDVNLPAAQLCIGMGLRLDRIPQIRSFFGGTPFDKTDIDFATAVPRAPKGHVIACRITAENALKGFQPTSGNIQELNFRSIPNVWGYFSVSSGGAVHEFADSQIGHLFASGPDRDQCRNTIILGLKELSIRGDISTPVDYLIRLMETPEFRNNTTSTAWLDSLIAKGETTVPQSVEQEATVVICGAVCQAFRKQAERKREFVQQLTAGRVPTRQLLQLSDRIVLNYADVEYVCDVKACGPESFSFQLVPPPPASGNLFASSGEGMSLGSSFSSSDSGVVLVEVRPFTDGGVLVIFDGKSRNCYLSNNPPLGWKLVIDKKQHTLESQRDPTKILTSSNGKIVKYLVPNGTRVKAGTAFVECEIMKMILPLVCEIDGTLRFSHAEGTVLESGELIARVEPDDLSSIRKARPFRGRFPVMAGPRAPETKPYLSLVELQKSVELVMSGYACTNTSALALSVLGALMEPRLPLSRFQQVLSEHKASLPGPLKSLLEDMCTAYEKLLADDSAARFPAAAMLEAVRTHAAKITNESERSSWLANMSGFTATLTELDNWNTSVPEEDFVKKLLQSYLAVEATFEDRPQEVVLMELRDANKGNLDAVYKMAMSYYSDSNKVEFLSELLAELTRRFRVAGYKDLLRKLYVSPTPRHVRLSLVAGAALNRAGQPLPEKAKQLLLQELGAISDDLPEDVLLPRTLDMLMRTAYPLEMVSFALHHVKDRPRLAGAVMRQYVSLLIALLPFQEAKVIISETAPRLSLSWLTAPVDVNDQGLPEPLAHPQPNQASLRRSPDDIDLPASVLKSSTGPSSSRNSLACVFQDVDEARASLKGVLQAYHAPNDATTRNILVLVLLDGSGLAPTTTPRKQDGSGDRTMSDVANISGGALQQLLQGDKELLSLLVNRRIVRVTVILGRFPSATLFHTFRLRHGFREDLLYRNFVPELGFLLELRRLDRYDLELCGTDSQRVLVYSAVERLPEGSKRALASRERRLFVRSFVNIDGLQSLGGGSEQVDWSSSAFKEYFMQNSSEIEASLKSFGNSVDTTRLLRMLPEVESVFIESLNVLEHTIINRRQTPSATNSLFIAVMTRLAVSKKLVAMAVPFFMSCFGDRLSALSVHLVEFVLTAPATVDSHHQHETIRFVVTNASGVMWRMTSASESRSLELGVPSPRVQLRSSRINDIVSSESQYIPNAAVTSRRRHCRLLNTTYVYDLLDVLERALVKAWNDHRRKLGLALRQDCAESIRATELRLDANDVMQPLQEAMPPESNDVGMVAWRITIDTPEYPKGREMILIANDVSFEGGSFGPREDALFKQASQLARALGIPRIYVSANAGARIGLADELLQHFCVAWKDENDPSKGFEYLYLTRETAAKMSKSVKVRAVAGHPDRMEITDVIGVQHGIGVENLQGSGLIAGETSLAYKETFTLTIVTGRSVGIGAYVTRLGQRVIQNQGPILLTGFDALNRLLGRDIYISNTQMGGPAIMYRNGVSHVDVNSDLAAFSSMLAWLAFVPCARGQDLPVLVAQDPLSRAVTWTPEPSIAYDPRHLLEGQTDRDGTWRGGFFDKGSFVETLGGWARTVVTGRARLGGIPVGVIAVETRSVQKAVPADPASDDSRELVSQQAGQVWYPDSAYKTAQAVWDFNNGEQVSSCSLLVFCRAFDISFFFSCQCLFSPTGEAFRAG